MFSMLRVITLKLKRTVPLLCTRVASLPLPFVRICSAPFYSGRTLSRLPNHSAIVIEFIGTNTLLSRVCLPGLSGTFTHPYPFITSLPAQSLPTTS